MTKPPVHATLTQVEGQTAITVEGTRVGTAPTQAQAVNVLCSEALRVGRPIVVTIHTGGNTKHLDISETGYAAWVAGSAPTTAKPVIKKLTVEPTKLLRGGVAPQPGHTPSTTVTAGTAAPIASATRTVTGPGSGTVPSGPTTRSLRRRRLTATLAAGAATGLALLTGGYVTAHTLTEADQVRAQTAAWSAATATPVPDATAGADRLPTTLSAADVETTLVAASARHRVRVDDVTVTGPVTNPLTLATGPATEQLLTVTATVTGPRSAVAGYLTTLAGSGPATTLTESRLAPARGAGVRATLTFTVHGLDPEPAR